MKIGDLVKYKYKVEVGYDRAVGVIVGFDRDDDPIVYQSHNGEQTAHWLYSVEVINEDR